MVCHIKQPSIQYCYYYLWLVVFSCCFEVTEWLFVLFSDVCSGCFSGVGRRNRGFLWSILSSCTWNTRPGSTIGTSGGLNVFTDRWWKLFPVKLKKCSATETGSSSSLWVNTLKSAELVSTEHKHAKISFRATKNSLMKADLAVGVSYKLQIRSL